MGRCCCRRETLEERAARERAAAEAAVAKEKAGAEAAAEAAAINKRKVAIRRRELMNTRHLKWLKERGREWSSDDEGS